MKKYIYIFLVALMGINTSCSDYLEVTSPSNVDADFVFYNTGEAYKVIIGGYDLYRDAYTTFFYDIDVVGSDAECHPEAYSSQIRHIAEGLFATDGSIDVADYITVWSKYYKLANRANIIIDQMDKLPGFQADWAKSTPTTWTQLYGEAVVMRAIAYQFLTRYFGDIPHFTTPIVSKELADSAVCTSRDEIIDFQIAELKRVEPKMFRLGEGGIGAERFSRTFAQGLIGRLALYSGGFNLRRNDFDYGAVTFEDNTADFVRTYRNCMYVRRTDWQDYYKIAKEYLQMCVDNSGSAILITTDNRTPASAFSNPFQRNFQYTMDLSVSPESVFEIGYTQTLQSEWGYAFSRPSDGGGGPAYPCKAYGQSRVYASVYYGDFDTLDLRRDVTVSVTANSGACAEKIMTFAPGSRSNGGLAINKWDQSRMSNPYTLKQRQSGMNAVTMRMADVILMLAETYAYLDPANGGSATLAAAEWSKVRARAFSPSDKAAKVDAYIAARSTGDALKEGIAQERKIEFIGEGIRRWDLIRTGKLPQKIVELRARQLAMYNGIANNHYYTFAETGMTIADTIYTKSLNTSSLGMTKMLTTQCDVTPSDPTYPVKFPSWRGNHDGWGGTMRNDTLNRNLAIVGINRYIPSTSIEGTALIAAGYKKTNWGNIIKANKAQYVDDIFKGYPDDSYTAKLPPLVIIPLSTETITKSNGLITNGYGFESPTN